MSEKKVNQRVMITKRLVHEALLEMLKTQNINKISIRELCQIAGINRTTFYNHYGSQYDVLNEIALEYVERTSYTVITTLAEGKNFLECLIDVLQYVQDHLEFATLILKQDNYDLVGNIKVSLPQFDEMIIQKLPPTLDADTKQAIASYVQHGTVRLLKEWILNGCEKAPEDEAKLILYVAGRTMRNV